MKFERASIAGTLLAATVLFTACGGAGHSWRGEFDARLEAASTAIEARLPELQSSSSEVQILKAGTELGRTLESETRLIEELHPPAACEAVEEEGRREVDGAAALSYDTYKNLTPTSRRRLPQPFEEVLANFKATERKAAHCESS